MKAMYRHAPKLERTSESRAAKARVGRDKNRSRKTARKAPKNRRKSESGAAMPSAWVPAARRIASVVAAIVAIVGAAMGMHYGWEALLKFDKLAVQDVQISGAAQADRATLIAYAGVSLGQSILEVDLEAAAEGLRRHPWIKSASVIRSLPNRLTFIVTEEKPFAIVSVDGLYLANEEGYLFKRMGSLDSFSLPIVTGLSREDVANDPDRVARRVLDAIELADDLAEWKDSLGRLDELHWDPVLGWSVVSKPERFGGEPVTIALGLHPHGRIPLAARAAVELDRRGQVPSQIWVDGIVRANRVHARLRQEVRN